MKKLICIFLEPLKSKSPAILGILLMLLGNEVISMAVLSVLVFMGIAKLFGAIAEVGDW